MDEKEKLQRRKKWMQFRYRRDVGEEVDIKSLPPTLIEASRKLYHEFISDKFKETIEEKDCGCKHQEKIAKDTVKNPNKELLGGPTAKEAEEMLKSKYKYSDKKIAKLKEDEDLNEGLGHDAVHKFAAMQHDNWRKSFDPEGTGKERIKKNSDGSSGDINVPFENLHPDWKHENLEAGKAALIALHKHKNNLEGAAEHVHNEWMKRNPKGDWNAAQHVPYSELPENEKEKDREHVRTMQGLLGRKKMNEAYWYHAKPVGDGDYEVTKINNEKNPYNHKVGDKVKKGEHSVRQYTTDGSAYGPDVTKESIFEAVKNIMKKKKVEKIKLKNDVDAKWKRSHVKINPKYDEGP